MTEQQPWKPDMSPKQGCVYIFGIDDQRPCKLGGTVKPAARLSSLRTVDKTADKLGLTLDKRQCKFLYAWPVTSVYPHIGIESSILRELTPKVPRLWLRVAKKHKSDCPMITEWFDLTPDELRKAVLGTHAFRRMFPYENVTPSLCRAREHAKSLRPCEWPQQPLDPKGKPISRPEAIRALAALGLERDT